MGHVYKPSYGVIKYKPTEVHTGKDKEQTYFESIEYFIYLWKYRYNN